MYFESFGEKKDYVLSEKLKSHPIMSPLPIISPPRRVNHQVIIDSIAVVLFRYINTLVCFKNSCKRRQTFIFMGLFQESCPPQLYI